ncbi:MAG: DinB family protein [Dehalococcoidia bacterium]
MTTIAEHLAELDDAYDAYMTELKKSGPVWEKKPAAAEGEEAWSARQVAEHVAGAATFFGAGLAFYIKEIQGPERHQPEFATAEAAVEGTPGAHSKLVEVVRQIPEDKLSLEIEAPQLGKNTVSGFVGIAAHHLRDHAQQLAALRG